MRTPAVFPARTAPILSILAVVAVLSGGSSRPSAAPGASAESLSALPDPGALQALDPRFAAAATAVRKKDCEAAFRELAPLTEGGGEAARRARLIAGLHAYACDSRTRALQWLASSGAGHDPLEDWRLFALAETAHQAGQVALGHDSFAHLLADYRSSPLWRRALAVATERSYEDGDAAGALELVRWSREQTDLGGETIGPIERIAWRLGQERGDRELLDGAARRLLVHAPVVADELDVVELFRPAKGSLSWAAILSPEELRTRAQSLLAAGLPGPATVAFEAVAVAARDLEWRLASARALLADRRPGEALSRLAAAQPANDDERSLVLLEQARVETALASQPAGRKRSAVAERARRAAVAQTRWRQLAGLSGGNPEARIQALRRVTRAYDSEAELPLALATLRSLRALAADDTSGAPYLWTTGWKQFAGGRYASALTTWAELATLYPESREARAGSYWTGRALERLGRRDQALTTFRSVAATDTTDFYRRHALARLGPAAATIGPAPALPLEAWPAEPRLDRARLLTDLGLDRLALEEVQHLGDGLSPRAKDALVGLAMSRQGRRRESIPYLRRAFPALGGARQAGVPEQARRLYYPLEFASEVTTLAEQAGLEPTLVYGVIRQESAFDLSALSHAGARGLMQLMPGTGRETAKRLGLPFSVARLADPAFNLTLGTTYLSNVLDLFNGREELALAGYNGGPYRIQRLWRQAGPAAEVDAFLEGLAIEESRTYVKRVLLFADSYRQLYGDLLGQNAPAASAAP